MNKAINLIKRLVLFFVGMSIIQFGVALFLKTSIGSDPFTVFTQGLAMVLNKTGLKDLSIVQMISGRAEVTPGVANMIILIVLFIGILIVDMKRIKIGTLICVVGVGPIIDLGVKAVLVKSFARIHRANLINAGILPLNFVNEEDYDNISLGDKLSMKGIIEGIKNGGNLTVKNLTNGKEIKVTCELSSRAIDIVLAGGLLSYTKEKLSK